MPVRPRPRSSLGCFRLALGDPYGISSTASHELWGARASRARSHVAPRSPCGMPGTCLRALILQFHGIAHSARGHGLDALEPMVDVA